MSRPALALVPPHYEALSLVAEGADSVTVRIAAANDPSEAAALKAWDRAFLRRAALHRNRAAALRTLSPRG